jgi:hypothetical protein
MLIEEMKNFPAIPRKGQRITVLEEISADDYYGKTYDDNAETGLPSVKKMEKLLAGSREPAMRELLSKTVAWYAAKEKMD